MPHKTKEARSAYHKGYRVRKRNTLKEKDRLDRLANPSRYRRYKLKEYYGMSLEDYEQLHVAQNGLCASCGKPETMLLRGKLTWLAVDHDHITGKVRGLLCRNCNTAFGLLHEDINTVHKLLSYAQNTKTRNL